MIKVLRARKYGFCSGVRNATLRVKKFAATKKKGAILGQLVHNERVVEEMEQLGIKTVEKLSDVKEPHVIFSAHGVPPSFYEKAEEKGLEVIDATCKFVLDIHKESKKALDRGEHLVFIGDPNHREVIGYTYDLGRECFHIIQNLGQAEEVDWKRYPAVRIFYQTTLNADEYEEIAKYISLENPLTHKADTICYATKKNQQAARELATNPEVDLIMVIGGKKSANTKHLYDICKNLKPTHLIHGLEDIDPRWLKGVKCVGLTAGASTPDEAVEEVEKYLISL